MAERPDYCPCWEEKPDPCPACGATVSGNDPVRGVCQARYGVKLEPLVELVVVRRAALNPQEDTP